MKIKKNNKKIYVFISEDEYNNKEYKEKIENLKCEESNIIIFVGGEIEANKCIKEMLEYAN